MLSTHHSHSAGYKYKYFSKLNIVLVSLIYMQICKVNCEEEQEISEAGPELPVIRVEVFENATASFLEPGRANSIMTRLTTDVRWIQDLIARHNQYRQRHNAPPLVFNHTLCQISQAYADTLARTKRWGHNYAVLNRYGMGENLARFTQIGTKKHVPGPKSVDMWYDELKDYNFRTGSPLYGNRAVGHFTQVVWRSTVQVGAAMAIRRESNNRRYIYVVANYYPRGNVMGQFVRNVGPRRYARGNENLTVAN